jgi:hypothetical protein
LDQREDFWFAVFCGHERPAGFPVGALVFSCRGEVTVLCA